MEEARDNRFRTEGTNMKSNATYEPYPWEAAYKGLQRSLQEDIKALKAMVDDEDSCCATRELRRARMSGLEHAIAVSQTLSRWEW